MRNKEIKILLVDDEPDIIEIVRYNLEQVGYQIFSASDGLEALKVADKELPHLIILDVMMPNLNGIETCEKLRQDDRFLNTIIMFLTARGEDYSFVAAFDVGADDYVTKPIKPKVLVSKVKGLLRRFKEDIAPKTTLDFYNLVINREEYKLLIDGEETAIYLAKKFGVPDKLIRDADEREQLVQMAQQMQQQQQQGELPNASTLGG